jgi:hypothetical protein
VWLGHHRGIKAPGLFALYVTGYSAFRIFEESLRVDPSEHFLGLRLNMFVAIAGTIAGGVWFWYTQRHGKGVPATDGAVARSAAGAGDGAGAEDAPASEGEQPAGTAGEPAGDAAAEGAAAEGAAAEGTAEPAAQAGPGGEPPAEVGADVGGDHSAETPPSS